MQFIKRRLFTLIGIIAAIIVLGVEKIGDLFLLAPHDKFYIDIVVSALLVAAGILLDINLQKLAKEKKIEKKLRAINEELDRANRELRESLAKVKVLSGLLPICASCNKVRDDKGYWQQVEVYLREHSEARLTHWICPECVELLWRKSHRREREGRGSDLYS